MNRISMQMRGTLATPGPDEVPIREGKRRSKEKPAIAIECTAHDANRGIFAKDHAGLLHGCNCQCTLVNDRPGSSGGPAMILKVK